MGASELFSVAGRTAVVTGASSGFGHRFARLLAGEGARVLAVARREDRLRALAEEVPGVVPLRADLLDEDERRRVVEVALQELGSIDVLVNNAGGSVPVPAVDENVAHFRQVLQLNLVAAFDLARSVAPHMIERGKGSIVNIGSVLGQVASAPIADAAYCSAKAGLLHLTRELGCQWARKGVRVNAIAPGYFPTDLTTGMAAGTSGGDYVLRNCPMNRFGAIEELDGALLYLASDASSYCTAQVINVDGGWTAR